MQRLEPYVTYCYYSNFRKSFPVYPALSEAGKEHWQDIELSYKEEELTLQGYERKRRKLFINEGFMVGEDAPKKETKQDEKKSSDENSLPGAAEEFQLFSRNECIEVKFRLTRFSDLSF